MNQIMLILVLNLLILTGCLKTRNEVGETEQSQFYGKKNASNQAAAQQESQLNQKINSAQAAVDERDELIRTLNGRVENLESQIHTLSKDKEKEANSAQEAQKVQLLQESLTKMQNQIQKLEAEQAQKQAALEAALIAAKKEDEKDSVKETIKASSKEGSKDNLKDKDSVKSNHKKNSHDKVAEKNSNIYEVAQGHFASKEWKKAILNYQKYVDEFPKGKEVSDSKYKIGVCFQELGMKDEAMAFYEEVVAHFSKSEAGKKAKLRLSKLKSKN